MLKWAWKNIMNKDQPKHEVIFLFVLIGFIINATFETATSTPGFLLSIVLFGIVYRKNALYISQR